jgi:peptidyl-prolyl cis-trans isomerase C
LSVILRLTPDGWGLRRPAPYFQLPSACDNRIYDGSGGVAMLMLNGQHHGIGRLRAIAQSRLAQFLVLGGIIFALAPPPDSGRDIHLDATTFDALEAAQARRLASPALAEDELSAVRSRALEDEILYREAIRLGLDKNDNIVRERLIQKVLFLAEDLAGVSRSPTEQELADFFAATGSQWVQPARVRLIHVYAGPAHREQVVDVRDQVIAAETAIPNVPPPLGEAFGLSRAVDASRDDVAATYGPAFTDAVFAMGMGEWSQPVQSKFGWHLVKVLERSEARPASFEDVKGKLPLLYLATRKKQAAAAFLRQAAARYRITIDGRPVTHLPFSGRVAPQRSTELD